MENIDEIIETVKKDRTMMERMVWAYYYSFSEHMQICDRCTLTWSNKFCEEFNQFIQIFIEEVKFTRMKRDMGIIVMIETEHIHIGSVILGDAFLAKKLFEAAGVEVKHAQ